MTDKKSVGRIRQSLRYASHLVNTGEYERALSVLNDQVRAVERLCGVPNNSRSRRSVARAVAHEAAGAAGRWPPRTAAGGEARE